MVARKVTIYRAGVEAFGSRPNAQQEKLLKAIAAMMAEATKKPSTRKKPTEGPKLAVTPKELYEACLERVPHIIACEPYDKSWFGRLGKKLQQTNGLRADDLEKFVSWVESGGLEFFSDCTFAHVIKHWDVWIVKARSGDTHNTTRQDMDKYL